MERISGYDASGDAGGVAIGEDVAAFGDGVFGLRKKKLRGSDAWRMVLPLDPQRLLREAPRN